ncbi:pyridoxal phosphate phosphatase PHOSPHO2 [Esox lucius]|uniref:Phosphatase phospho2 n=1 Tax=Esox lucius TaxID=8010 RepID=A0AAY5L7L6_ESOLU|nr:pyridoxal phosphate phosphatase PHOSPHO2 [Esox lucius]XP_010884744.1 pyridoxal phosphate phosphatase PHOSPHO2 [Esox lucius]XP_010884745.1 pyridoxal phosphate phosphatase PHOSPHO2 [Esox lucius]
MKTLVVFDFDYTIVDDNSDTWVIKCVAGECLPDIVKNTYKKGRWTEYMGRVMSYIGDQKVSPDAVRSVMETIPFTDGMMELLRFIANNKNDIDCIIISDSNTVFINWILQAAGIQDSVDRIFTNPASFDKRGYLEIECYHSHSCRQCPVNICKKKVLTDFLAEKSKGNEEYQRIFYVGDGGNDFCPSNSLKSVDVVFPRKGFTLERLLSRQSAQQEEDSLKPKVIGWTSGIEILNELKSSLQL